MCFLNKEEERNTMISELLESQTNQGFLMAMIGVLLLFSPYVLSAISDLPSELAQNIVLLGMLISITGIFIILSAQE